MPAGGGLNTSPPLSRRAPGHSRPPQGPAPGPADRRGTSRSVTIMSNCVPCLFRKAEARHGSGPEWRDPARSALCGVAAGRGRSAGDDHCRAGAKHACGGPPSFNGRMISGTGADLGFCWWQVLGSNQRRLSRRCYRRTSSRASGPLTCAFKAAAHKYRSRVPSRSVRPNVRHRTRSKPVPGIRSTDTCQPIARLRCRNRLLRTRSGPPAFPSTNPPPSRLRKMAFEDGAGHSPTNSARSCSR
jgi:hypothetical protein